MRVFAIIKAWIMGLFVSRPIFDPSNPWDSSPEAAKFYKIDEPLVINPKKVGDDALTRKADEIIMLHNADDSHLEWTDDIPDDYEIDVTKRVHSIPVDTRQAVIDDFKRTLRLLDQNSAIATDVNDIKRRVRHLNRMVEKERYRHVHTH